MAKIVISRKGSDSGSGGMASPILPCGCLCSIPIPYDQSTVRFSDIQFGKWTLQDICSQLNPHWKDGPAHLDPDLRFESLVRRPKGWRPAFGQSEISAAHLNKQHVREGDLFLFFGWFRRTKKENGKLTFDSGDNEGRHIVYGWLQIGAVHHINGQPLPNNLRFLASHPHIRFAEHFAKKKNHTNQVYVSSDAGLGAGVFGMERADIVLTKPGYKRSQWLLPKEFNSLRCDLSYHHNPTRWAVEEGRVRLDIVHRGQEFVLDGELHPDVRQYFSELIRSASKTNSTCSHDF